MKKMFLGACALVGMVMMTGCQESLEERAAREAKEYTEKFCPTPPKDDSITDSITFDVNTKTHWEYYTLVGANDNPDAIAPHIDEIKQKLLENIIHTPGWQAYKDAGFKFGFVVRSKQHPDITVLNVVFGPKDYGEVKK